MDRKLMHRLFTQAQVERGRAWSGDPPAKCMYGLARVAFLTEAVLVNHVYSRNKCSKYS